MTSIRSSQKNTLTDKKASIQPTPSNEIKETFRSNRLIESKNIEDANKEPSKDIILEKLY